jgi:hypothetical protein
MSSRIIYKNDAGGVAVIIPSEEYLSNNSIESLVHLVPSGQPYKIVDSSEIPEDREFRDAWTWED